MCIKNICLIYFLLSFQNVVVFAWENGELEIFDLVEEIDTNFYTLLNVQEDADLTTIKKAFRNLSLVLHPDKNDSPDANKKFRQLVAVYDVLKDSGKRERYDNVLKNGLPDWRSAVYYYRHYRKMGLLEMSIILFVLVSIGQYAVGWAAYLEKKYTAEQILGSKRKRTQKKKKNGIELEDILNQIPSPSLTDTLPIQIPKLIWSIITGFPATITLLQNFWHKRKEKLVEQQRTEELQKEKLKAEKKIAREKEESRRKRKIVVVPERPYEDEPHCLLDPVESPETKSAEYLPPITGGLWTDDDLADLIKLVKKYPGGTSQRWEKIAQNMNRSVPEVTFMAAKMKDNCYILPRQEEEQLEEQPKKVKTKGGKFSPMGVENENLNAVQDSVWSQAQQKALENALIKFPKGTSIGRWDKIANCVPEKTKEECILRYKYLADLVKKQKHKEQQEDGDVETCE